MAEEEVFDDEEDIDLASLDDDELVEQMHDDLYDGVKEEIGDKSQAEMAARRDETIIAALAALSRAKE